MRKVRFPIAGLMGAVLIVALGLAALRNASATWSAVTFLVTGGVLCLAIVGVVCREGADRAWWLGFALFGWGYLILAFWSSIELPTMGLLDAIGSRLGVKVQFSGGMRGGMSGFRNAPLWAGGGFFGGLGGPRFDRPLQEIAHCLWALLAALVGGTLARLLFGDRKERTESVAASAPGAVKAHARPWLWPAIVGLTGCALVVVILIFGSKSVFGFSAGVTFLLTCGLLGMTILGVAGGQGVRRQIWLGAAIFGVGYMTIAFGRSLDQETWPELPTDHLLYGLRRWFPPIVSGFPTASSGIAAANARIWEALDRPVPMPFAQETPLEDVLTHIKAQTRGPNGQGIPIYLDPIGLQEAERSMTSVVAIDLEGVALKTSLQLCLKQLGLSYRIRDGLLIITSEESAVIPVYQDPFLIVGHCVLALLAAGFGGILAPFFFRPHFPVTRDRPTGAPTDSGIPQG